VSGDTDAAAATASSSNSSAIGQPCAAWLGFQATIEKLAEFQWIQWAAAV
jgi:hypothetical protein